LVLTPAADKAIHSIDGLAASGPRLACAHGETEVGNRASGADGAPITAKLK
jgi:hypothetical protein